MNDIRSLLLETVPPDLRTEGRWPDTESDLARGRALLARRRRGALVGGTGLVTAGTVGALLLTGVLTPSGRSAPTASASSAGGSARGSVALVAYEGTQPEGYTLKTIPQGWE